jgi:hypothetical protein
MKLTIAGISGLKVQERTRPTAYLLLRGGVARDKMKGPCMTSSEPRICGARLRVIDRTWTELTQERCHKRDYNMHDPYYDQPAQHHSTVTT